MESWFNARPGVSGVLQGLWLPAPACLLLWLLTGLIAPDPIPEPKDWTAFFVEAVLFAPLLETAILWGACALARKRWQDSWWVAVVGASPVIALHAPNSWQSVLCMTPFFVWSAWYLLQRTAWGDQRELVFLRLVAMHAIWNLLVLSIYLITR